MYSVLLYIFLFLHQTATGTRSLSLIKSCISSYSYIKPKPRYIRQRPPSCCISSYSYIKPQRNECIITKIVACISSYSYIKPQLPLLTGLCLMVVYLLIPTSNRNDAAHVHMGGDVVYLLIPTSNRNHFGIKPTEDMLYIFLFLHQTATHPKLPYSVLCCISSYSYIKPQLSTSHHLLGLVVYLLIPTSNRNQVCWLSC